MGLERQLPLWNMVIRVGACEKPPAERVKAMVEGFDNLKRRGQSVIED